MLRKKSAMLTAILLSLLAQYSIALGQTEALHSPDSLLSTMASQWEEIRDCTGTMETYIKLGDKEERRTFEYKFKKPQWVKTKIISGSNVGAELLYDPVRKRVIAHAGGVLSFINVSFSPANPRVQSLRGHSMDNNHMGHIIGRWIEYSKKLETRISEKDGVITLDAEGIDTLKYHGAYRERLFVDSESLFPRGFEQYDIAGELIHEVKLSDIRINVGLQLKDFEL